MVYKQENVETNAKHLKSRPLKDLINSNFKTAVYMIDVFSAP